MKWEMLAPRLRSSEGVHSGFFMADEGSDGTSAPLAALDSAQGTPAGASERQLANFRFVSTSSKPIFSISAAPASNFPNKSFCSFLFNDPARYEPDKAATHQPFEFFTGTAITQSPLMLSSVLVAKPRSRTIDSSDKSFGSEVMVFLVSAVGFSFLNFFFISSSLYLASKTLPDPL